MKSLGVAALVVIASWCASCESVSAQAPETTPAGPLIEQLLLAPDPRTSAFRQRAGLAQMTVAELIDG